MKRTLSIVSFLIILVFISCQQKKKSALKLPVLFSDHMVLQQEEEISIWGKDRPNQKISATGSWGEKKSTHVDQNGNWKLTLKTPKAGGPYSLSVMTKDSTAVFKDVLIGEVWLASGQSNMQMPLKGWPPNDPILNSEIEIASSENPEIRMFTVERALSTKTLDTLQGSWAVSNNNTAGDFSATAFFFAKRLQKELQVPIGIIHSSWGGTVAEAWTSESSLRNLSDFNETLDMIKNPEPFKLTKNWFAQFPSQNFPETKEQWEQIEFADLDAAQLDFDDATWSSTELPGRVDVFENGEFDGAIWIRKEFEITDISTDYTLHIGAIDDMDATYVNGKKIGGLAGNGVWNTERNINVPKNLLKKGTNIIAIRVIDTGGKGSVEGRMELVNEKGLSISLAGEWNSLMIAEIYLGKFYGYGLKNDLSKRPDIQHINPNIPTVLYNAMINPLVPYSIKGAIWYQGESNVGRDIQYMKLFPAMINDWREKWNIEFPFYFVQIAPYTYDPNPSKQVSQKLREAQRLSLNTPKTGMVVTLDIGNPQNIHPANKQDVGSRLAGLALANDYGFNLVSSGPSLKKISQSNHKLILEFDHIGGGLIAAKSGLSGFEIAGADKRYLEAKAKIIGNTIELECNGMKEPVFARYAWSDDSTASLFNQEGLPASSFSSGK